MQLPTGNVHSDVDALINERTEAENNDSEGKKRLREDREGVGRFPGSDGLSCLSRREPLEESRYNESDEKSYGTSNLNNEIKPLDDRAEDDRRENNDEAGGYFYPFVGTVASPGGRKRSEDGVSERNTIERERRYDIEYWEEHYNVGDDLSPNWSGIRAFETQSRVVFPVEGDHRGNAITEIHGGRDAESEVERESRRQGGAKHGADPVLLFHGLYETGHGVMQQLREDGSGEDRSEAREVEETRVGDVRAVALFVAAVGRLVHGDDGGYEHDENGTKAENAEEDLQTDLLRQVHADEGRHQTEEK